jgi:hypothetical protein
VYANVAESLSGTYSGTSFEAPRWIGKQSHRWDDLTDCDADENRDQHANAADDAGRGAVTFDRTGRGSFSVIQEANDAAPHAVIVDSTSWQAMGRAIILGVRGAWASGYRGYLNGKIAAHGSRFLGRAALAHGQTR